MYKLLVALALVAGASAFAPVVKPAARSSVAGETAIAHIRSRARQAELPACVRAGRRPCRRQALPALTRSTTTSLHRCPDDAALGPCATPWRWR